MEPFSLHFTVKLMQPDDDAGHRTLCRGLENAMPRRGKPRTFRKPWPLPLGMAFTPRREKTRHAFAERTGPEEITSSKVVTGAASLELRNCSSQQVLTTTLQVERNRKEFQPKRRGSVGNVTRSIHIEIIGRLQCYQPFRTRSRCI